MYTRYLQSMDRATIHNLHDKSLHIFPHICVGSFIQSMKHFFCVLFIYFVFVLILFYSSFFFWIFLMTQTNFFSRTQDERTGRMTYLDTLAPTPKLEWSSVGVPSWLFFCMQCRIERIHLREFKHAMIWKEKICKKINYPICKCRKG